MIERIEETEQTPVYSEWVGRPDNQPGAQVFRAKSTNGTMYKLSFFKNCDDEGFDALLTIDEIGMVDQILREVVDQHKRVIR
jgi:hypothetical protein